LLKIKDKDNKTIYIIDDNGELIDVNKLLDDLKEKEEKKGIDK
jgi:hypothetical protein